MDSTINIAKEKMEKAIQNMQTRFANVRAGRPSASILDDVLVDYYGVATSIIQLATISVPDAKQILIKPFDKNCLSDIEKGIYESNLGLTPNNNGETIMLVFPPLTEERRKEFVKQVKEMAEDAKITLRNIRQDVNSEIKQLKLPEDEEKKGVERVQNIINDYNKKVDELLKLKEKDLMTI